MKPPFADLGWVGHTGGEKQVPHFVRDDSFLNGAKLYGNPAGNPGAGMNTSATGMGAGSRILQDAIYRVPARDVGRIWIGDGKFEDGVGGY
jgi:hypothetical protein